jgi:hypothetical protein
MCKGAQNRIEYIVFQRPFDASKILESYGYEAPGKVDELTKAVKQLVKKKGEPVVKDLINIHPEKKIILEMSGHKSDESSFCGCHSAYTGEIKDLSVSDLTQLYEDTKKKSKEAPEDKTVMAQMETVWDELKRRKKQTEKQEKENQQNANNIWLKMGLCFLAGIIIAKIV